MEPALHAPCEVEVIFHCIENMDSFRIGTVENRVS